MSTAVPARCRQIRSTVTKDGVLELSIAEIDVPVPADHEVLVRVEAAPINPSDLGLLFGPADMASAEAVGTPERPVVRAPIPPGLMRMVAGRVDQSLPVGNEGGGVVVAAGSSPEAQALVGKTVGILGGATYSQYRAVPAFMCLALPDGVTPTEGASCFVNPLTTLGFLETLRAEGHSALVHTAAASNLGQMLVKLCKADSVPLVNVVRKSEQVDLLKSLGAQWICNSSEPDFMDRLTDAVAESGATLGFDATGGGKLAGQILTAMEAAAVRKASEYSRYGSTVHKQVYIYGGLDRSPTLLNRNFGMSWGLGGWLLTPLLQKIGRERAQELRNRVAAEIRTTFASHYTRTVSLAEALSLDAIRSYGQQATGQKYLIDPNA